MLLSMNLKFELECPEHSCDNTLVTDTCCRNKNTYFIVGPESRIVGYLAVVVAANRRISAWSTNLGASDLVDDTLTLEQIYVEPEYRRQDLACQALELLLQG